MNVYIYRECVIKNFSSIRKVWKQLYWRAIMNSNHRNLKNIQYIIHSTKELQQIHARPFPCSRKCAFVILLIQCLSLWKEWEKWNTHTCKVMVRLCSVSGLFAQPLYFKHLFYLKPITHVQLCLGPSPSMRETSKLEPLIWQRIWSTEEQFQSYNSKWVLVLPSAAVGPLGRWLRHRQSLLTVRRTA